MKERVGDEKLTIIRVLIPISLLGEQMHDGCEQFA